MTTTSKMPTRHRIPIDRTTPPRPPRLGKVRLGIQATTAKGVSYPKAVDYFRVDEDESGITAPAVAAAFRDQYGDQPNILHVMLLHERTEHVLESAYRLYGASKLKRVCDGATCSVRQAKGGWLDGPCACDAEGLAPDDKGRCSLTHTFWFALPDLQLAPGLFELDTGSEIGERTLRDYLLFIEAARGTLMGYEFDLTLQATKVAPDGKAKTVYTLAPVAQASTVTMREVIAQAKTGALPVREVAELPPAPIIDETRDHLISPTPEARATAAAEAAPLEDAITNAFWALSPEEQNELVELVPADVLTAGLLADLYRDEARDLKMLLARLRAEALTQPTGLSVDPDPPPSDDRPSSPRSVSEESSEQLTVGGEDESA